VFSAIVVPLQESGCRRERIGQDNRIVRMDQSRSVLDLHRVYPVILSNSSPVS
jgi:hypothetical protein